MLNRLVIVASPRAQGRSAHVADALVARYAEGADTALTVFSLAEHEVHPCTGCDACSGSYRCVIDDDMQQLYPLVDAADDITVVSPVYFAGPPAQLKALLDRFEPFYWRYVATDGKRGAKRPLRLYVVGEGGDPNGFEPLVVCTRSAFAVAGLRLEDVYNGVGLEGSGLDDLAVNPEAYRYTSPSSGWPHA